MKTHKQKKPAKKKGPVKAFLYVVRLYDGFDDEWFTVSPKVSFEEATRIYNEKTGNGTHSTQYAHIDYYKIFPL